MIIIVSHKPLAILALSWIQEVGSPEKQFHCLLLLTLASKYTNSLEILWKNNPRIPFIQRRFYAYYTTTGARNLRHKQQQQQQVGLFANFSAVETGGSYLHIVPGYGWQRWQHCTLCNAGSARWRRRAKYEFKYVSSVVWEVSGSMACWSLADTSQSCPPVYRERCQPNSW